MRPSLSFGVQDGPEEGVALAEGSAGTREYPAAAGQSVGESGQGGGTADG